jgi:flagellar hook-length control protein FliK
MSDLHVEATQPTRGASTLRSTRAAAHEAADLTATFDQIFASVAQATRQPTPQVAPSAPFAPEPTARVAPPSDVVEPVTEEDAVADDSQDAQDSPVHATSPNHAKSLEPPAPVVAKPMAHRAEPLPVQPAAQVTERRASERKLAQQTTARTPAARGATEAATQAAATAKGKQTAQSAAERERADKKTEKQLRVDQAETPTKREGRVARLTAKGEQEAKPTAARAEVTANAAKTEEAAPVAVAAVESLTPVVTAAHATVAQPSNNEGRPAKPAGSKPPTLGFGISKPTPTPPPNAVTQESKTAEAAQAAALEPEVAAKQMAPAEKKPAATVKSDANPLETAAKTPAQPVDTAPAAPVVKAEPRVEAATHAVEKQVAAEVDSQTKVTPAPAQAVKAETVVAASAQVEAPVADRRRTRDARNTSTATSDVKVATQVSSTQVNGTVNAAPAVMPPAVQAAASAAAAAVAPAPPVTVATTDVEVTTNKSDGATVERARGVASAASTTPAPEAREKMATTISAKEAKAVATKSAANESQREVDRVRLIQRVAKAVQTAQDRGGTLRLRLTPPELGALKIELIMRDGALSAKLEAETPAAKTVILENLSALRERLTALDIKIERFDVDLMQQSDHSGGERQSFADAESSREQADLRRTWQNERTFTKPTATPSTERATPGRPSNQGLNVLA